MDQTSAKDLSPVNKAFCEALFSKYPKDRYVVPGSSSFIDSSVVSSNLSYRYCVTAGYHCSHTIYDNKTLQQAEDSFSRTLALTFLNLNTYSAVHI